MIYDQSQIVTISYTNYRGEKSDRRIVPLKIWFGSNEYHKDNQWLLDAFDITKDAIRSFAVKDITSWK
ncbi:WYL domain-containing protein [Candidatus Berkelbacteria bacterium]|nr:WYL domain-containing protein [Candidatus Berkelbacteria bacterium]